MMKMFGAAESELPTKHQFFQAIVVAVVVMAAEMLTKKGYVSAFKFLSRRKGR